MSQISEAILVGVAGITGGTLCALAFKGVRLLQEMSLWQREITRRLQVINSDTSDLALKPRGATGWTEYGAREIDGRCVNHQRENCLACKFIRDTTRPNSGQD